ncbi:MAG: PIN domain-containing protein [Candidatus Saccharimonadales bacterium]
MRIVDTNYLVRLFTNQPRGMALKALNDLEKSEPGSVLVPDFVISELIYVLEFHDELSYKRADILEGVRLILSHPALKIDNKLHEKALDIYESTKLDYVDCLTLAIYKLGQADSVLTFDKAMLKELRSSNTES